MAQEKKLDRRTQRSRRALREALVALILEKGYEAITVQEITDRADLNRGTLYLHYRDKHDLLLNSSNDIYDDLVAQFEPITLENLTMEDIPKRHLIILFQHVAANANFYRVMLGENGVASFITHLRHIAAQTGLGRLVSLQQFVASPKSVPSDLIASYIGGAIIGVIEWWLENNMVLSPEALAQYVWKLSVNAVYPSIGMDNPSSGKG